MTVLVRSVRAAIPAAIIAVAVYLCFMHKAFNIDDVTFLTMADHMLEDPLHPASVQISVNGRPPAWISAGMWSGPVMPAMLTPSVAAGGAEWLAHLMMLVVFLVGIAASAALAIRLGVSDRGARWVAILVTTSAAVLAMAQTSMPDIPTMSFAVLGVERMYAYRTEGGWWRAVLATLAIALCILSRQHGVLVFACALPLMFAHWPQSYGELFRGLVDRRFLVVVATIVAGVGLVFLTYHLMRDPQPGGLTSTPQKVADFTLWRANLPNIPAQYVLTFPLGLCWAWLHAPQMVQRYWCWWGVLFGCYLARETHVFHRHMDWMWWQAPITALGTVVLIDIAVEAVRRRDPIDLGLAAWLLIAVPVVVYSHLPAKYMVPCAPAVALLIVRAVERRPTPGRAYWGIGAVAAQGLILALLSIRADQVHAEVGRKGGDVVARYVKRGEKVWFDGTWAFQWYAQQAGAQPVTTVDPKPQPGDIVVVGLEGWVIRDWPNKELVERFTFTEPGGRILQKPAGFYSNVAWGPLPWRWSRKAHDPVEVWRIK